MGRPDSYFRLNDSGQLEIVFLDAENYPPQRLVTKGAYPDLTVTAFNAQYISSEDDPQKGGYVHVTYTIESKTLENHSRNEEFYYRLDETQIQNK